MMSKSVAALALLESVSAFQAPAMKASTKAVSATMFAEGDIGVTPPLGVYDPLGLIETKDMRRFEIMEIKHGRAAMLGFLHVILIHAGYRLPGYLSIQQGAPSLSHTCPGARVGGERVMGEGGQAGAAREASVAFGMGGARGSPAGVSACSQTSNSTRCPSAASRRSRRPRPSAGCRSWRSLARARPATRAARRAWSPRRMTR